MKILITALITALTILAARSVHAEDFRSHMQRKSVRWMVPTNVRCEDVSARITFQPNRSRPETRSVNIPLKRIDGVYSAIFWADQRLDVRREMEWNCKGFRSTTIRYQPPAATTIKGVEFWGSIIDHSQKEKDEEADWQLLCEAVADASMTYTCTIPVPDHASISMSAIIKT